jgi:iron complex transport system substrate-binding protein
MTLFADRAKAFRHDAGTAETVVDLKPDLVLAGRFSDAATRDIVRRVGYPVVEFDVARSIGEAIAQIRSVAGLVGHPDRGEALVKEIEAARQRAAASPGGASRPRAVFYQRRGYATGGSTLTGELMGLVGLANVGAVLAGRDGGFVPLERLIAEKPDYLVVDAAVIEPEDQGSALLAHPALAALYPPERRIVLPERLTVCGGPSLPQALDWLSGEVRRIVKRDGTGG